MGDSIDKKLDMSLDDLAKRSRQQQHHQHPRQGGGGGVGGGPHANRPQGPMMGSWPWRGGQGQAQPQQQQQQFGGQGGGRWPQHQQQQQQPYFDGPGGGQPQRHHANGSRSSVFSRLSGAPGPAGAAGNGPQQQPYQQGPRNGSGYPQQQQQQQPYRQPYQQRQQQQPHPQRQQQQPHPSQPPPKIERPIVKLKLDNTTGMVQMLHEGHVIIQVSPAGDVTLDSGGDHSPARRAALTIVLSHFNMAVREAPGAAAAGGQAQQQQPPWNVAEGHRLTRFSDGMKIAARGALTANRAMVLMQAYGGGGNKTSAAQEASMRAAVQAGILPADAAPTAAAAAPAAAAPEDPEAARIRRLKAQGRYVPY